MFLIWALSLPENQAFQKKLRVELSQLGPESLNQYGHPTVRASDTCSYLDAVIKETLRLYPPLPSYEPRSKAVASVIDGYSIPAGTVVGMAPYSMHRNPEVFEFPLKFDPDRWFGPQSVEMNRWFWAFSSGGRMCIGLQLVSLIPCLLSLVHAPRYFSDRLERSLAMAEMTTLTASIYRKYETSIPPDFKGVTPGITSRFELFYDESFSRIKVSVFMYAML